MIPFGVLGHISQGMMMVAWYVVFVLLAACTLRAIHYKVRMTYVATGLVSLLFSASVLFFLMYSVHVPDLKERTWFSSFFLSVPVWVVVVAFGIFVSVTVLLAVMLHRYARTHITANSVKESMDHIPTGLCFFNEEGRVLLENNAMEKIAKDINEFPLLNGGDFWKGILLRNKEKGEGEHPIIKTADGRVFGFLIRTLDFPGEVVHEIIASDITEEYRLHDELRLENGKLRKLNAYLRECGLKCKHLAAEKEALDVRMRIHDETGNLLLCAKRWDEHDPSQDQDALVRMFLEHAQLLKAERKPLSGLEELIQCAKTVGVSVSLQGRWPEDGECAMVFLSALRECVTNTVSHADGNEVCVSILEKDDGYVMSCINDGRVPDGPIVEKGGLLALRHLVERQGGSMDVEYRPRFRFIIGMRKERGSYACQSACC